MAGHVLDAAFPLLTVFLLLSFLLMGGEVTNVRAKSGILQEFYFFQH